MKVGLLGTGFGIAHAHIYHTHPEVSEVVVFGRTPAKLQAFAEKFGYATTTEVASIYDDPTIELVDVCLPDVDGFELAAQLQALDPRPTVILTSSRDCAELESLTAGGCACGVVPKDKLSGEVLGQLLARA